MRYFFKISATLLFLLIIPLFIQIAGLLFVIGYVASTSQSLGIIFKIEPKYLLIGIAIGLIYTGIGILLYSKSAIWKRSMTFLTGQGLTRGNIIVLFSISIFAGVIEEICVRMPVLILYDPKAGLTNSSLLLALCLNTAWALVHFGNVSKELRQSSESTISLALPHMLVIFISGIPLFFITLKSQSLLPAIITHFMLDFLMGLFIRKNNTIQITQAFKL